MGTGLPVGSLIAPGEVGPGCEPIADGFLREPASALSSLAFVVAAVVVVILASRRRRVLLRGRRSGGVVEPPSGPYAVLVAGIGLGSVVQHGPNPPWADLAHDVPLLATVALIVADAVADLTGRPRVWWWWALPTALLVPVIHWVPSLGDGAQGAVAVAAVLINLYRALRRPPLRPAILGTIGLLAVGGIIEIGSSPGWPWCDPETRWWYGHAVWHVLVATALGVLATGLGWREGPRDRPRDRAAVDV